MRKFTLILFGLFVFCATAANAQVPTLSVTSIGTIDVEGELLTAYTYTSENPTIRGTANPSEDVTITVDGVAYTVTANSSGIWTYTPSTLLDGDAYDIVIQSEATSIGFALTITEVGVGDVDDVVETTATLPDTGIGDYTFLLALGGIITLIGAGVVAFK